VKSQQYKKKSSSYLNMASRLTIVTTKEFHKDLVEVVPIKMVGKVNA